MTRVAIDLLGGDAGPQVVADAIASYLHSSYGNHVTFCVVGPTTSHTNSFASGG